MTTHSRKAGGLFPSVLARQQAFNRRTRGSTTLFEEHRRRVTAAIVQSQWSADKRLCILGAGNANDVDLPVLAAAFEQIHLVDLDGEALRKVVERWPGLNSVLRLHGGADLGGIAHRLDSLSHSPNAQHVDEIIGAAQRVPLPSLPHPYDVVASTCLLTQLMNTAVAAVGESEERLLDLLTAIRIGHLRLLTGMVAPGGTGLLFTDIASSDDAPEIAAASDPSRLADDLARRGKLFAGIDPQQIEDEFRHDPVIAPRIAALTRIGVWPWRISEARTFLVAGFSFRTLSRP